MTDTAMPIEKLSDTHLLDRIRHMRTRAGDSKTYKDAVNELLFRMLGADAKKLAQEVAQPKVVTKTVKVGLGGFPMETLLAEITRRNRAAKVNVVMHFTTAQDEPAPAMKAPPKQFVRPSKGGWRGVVRDPKTGNPWQAVAKEIMQDGAVYGLIGLRRALSERGLRVPAHTLQSAFYRWHKSGVMHRVSPGTYQYTGEN